MLNSTHLLSLGISSSISYGENEHFAKKNSDSMAQLVQLAVSNSNTTDYIKEMESMEGLQGYKELMLKGKEMKFCS